MVKKLLTGLCAGAMCVATVFAAAGCNDKKEDKKPVKIKDGISLTVGQGKSETVDLSQYPAGFRYLHSCRQGHRPWTACNR